MKKIIIIFLGLSSFIQAAAQWQGTNPVYVSSGYVGIGTSSPAYKLDITNLSTEQQNLFRIRVDGAPNDYFNIANATGASGQFIPYLHGFHSSDNREAL